ncbi:nucleotidyltransferase family protein [Flavimaricola marinus]|uniref:Nucleotidyltransferase family protein n=1 Tax=Flavimaricola marinus TaxID=1819565 RepID=A0A238LG22_9RHOB|nr:nucleotidyltransferase family protein [Flavimaricola marinus]SMY08365.1 hypothetical protein LOM8899_02516 [Flavimaricola marinus]
MTSPHLRYSGLPAPDQEAALIAIVQASPVLMRTFEAARALDLPDWWIVSGAIYNQVWNHLTGRPEMTGVKDIDLFYFDPDTSYEAEDAAIRRASACFAEVPPVEVRNQARVHLWYEQHFGQTYDPLTKTTDGIDNFVCQTHAVGMRLGPDGFEVYAPFGLEDIFAFRLTPNPVRDGRKTHMAKAARQSAVWPELEIVAWPD